MGLAEYALLAQDHRLKQPEGAIRACLQAIANVALLEIALKVASSGASRDAERYQKGRNGP
jgi:hypothetical protein